MKKPKIYSGVRVNDYVPNESEETIDWLPKRASLSSMVVKKGRKPRFKYLGGNEPGDISISRAKPETINFPREATGEGLG